MADQHTAHPRRGAPHVVAAARTRLGDAAVAPTLESYSGFYDRAQPDAVAQRKGRYRDFINQYYDLVTDFYEYGWGQSFHFAPRREGDRFADAIRESEIFVSDKLALAPGQRVADLGCGVGGPMRAIARHSGASIIGVNNNLYQVWKGNRANRGQGLAGRCRIVKADFHFTPLGDRSLDAVYAIEATCHAPDARTVFAEVARVLRPGGHFAFLDWCLSPSYQHENPVHRELRHRVEEGNALPELRTRPQVEQALDEAGLERIESFDRAEESPPGRPWYLPLTSREISLRGFQRSRPGRWLTTTLVRGLEGVGIAPRGATSVSRLLNDAADALVASGEAGIFSPLYFFRARRPA